MKFFDIATIKSAIESLQEFKANWLIPAFVFASNDIGVGEAVDMSKKLGTDRFLDQFFNGHLLGIEPYPDGTNLLRPRLKGIKWEPDEYIIRQPTKMWGNLFSSRGYREMRLNGLIEGEKAVVALTPAFQARFEDEIPSAFSFESFLIWLFAFDGFPDEVNSWSSLHDHLLAKLHLTAFKPPYVNRFRLAAPPTPWPNVLNERPTNDELLQALAPKLYASLQAGEVAPEMPPASGADHAWLDDDDPVFTEIYEGITHASNKAFLLLGCPGTGKSRYARAVASKLTSGIADRALFLQFHPSFSYDDFIEGFRPTASSLGPGVVYELKPRLFLAFSEKARIDPEHLYVAVIDELNRGDVARIFGEALTYLEDGYRGVPFRLAYSGDEVSIPKNLVVLATANPFDRSITELDDALLRRFWTIEINPDKLALIAHLESNGVPAPLIRKVAHVFERVSSAHPHGYGHAAFLGVRSIEDFGRLWLSRIRISLRRALHHNMPLFHTLSEEVDAIIQADIEVEAGAEVGQ